MNVGRTLFVAGLSIVVCAAFVRADYTLSYTEMLGSGSLTGNSIITFYAKNDGRNQQAGTVGLIGYEMYLDSFGAPLVFKSASLDGDAQPDIDLWGETMNMSAPEGTCFRLGAVPNMIRMVDMKSSLWLSTLATTPPQTYFANRTSIIATTISIPAPAANVGAGLRVAAVVVPTGTVLHFHGQMAAESGPIYGTGGGTETMTDSEYALWLMSVKDSAGQGDAQGPWFQVGIYTPEPGSMLALGAGMLLLSMCRRRPQ